MSRLTDAVGSAAREWAGMTLLTALGLVVGLVWAGPEHLVELLWLAGLVELAVTVRCVRRAGRRVRYVARSWWR